MTPTELSAIRDREAEKYAEVTVEIRKGREILKAADHYPLVNNPRLKMECFKAGWDVCAKLFEERVRELIPQLEFVKSQLEVKNERITTLENALKECKTHICDDVSSDYIIDQCFHIIEKALGPSNE